MTSLLEFLRSLGPSGAAANASVLLDQRRQEDRIVASVAHHLGAYERARATSRSAA